MRTVLKDYMGCMPSSIATRGSKAYSKFLGLLGIGSEMHWLLR